MITGIVVGRIVLVDARKRSVTMAIGRGCSTVEIGCSSMEEVKQAAGMLYETAKATVSEKKRTRLSITGGQAVSFVKFEPSKMED